MPPASRSPFDDTDRVLIDGTNLLHRMGTGAPQAAIVAQLRAAIPLPIAVELVFDGMGHGVTGRVAQAMHVRHAGRRTGDEAILELVGDARPGSGSSPLAAARTLVVTDDRDLRTALVARGARTAGVAWLLGRLNIAPAAPPTGRRPTSIGSGKPPAGAATGAGDEAAGRPGWKPGRGATAKSGTAHKVARHRRHPRHP